MASLKDLAETCGIASSYVDKTGKTHYTEDPVRSFFLDAMGIKNATLADCESSLNALNSVPLLPEVITFFDDEIISIKPFQKCHLTLKDENNTIIAKKNADSEQEVIFSDLRPGYYTLIAKTATEQKESLLIFAPKLCYQPDFIKNKQHIFGVSLMLYALRSKNSLGIGDFGDLKEIVELTAKNGGDVVGINPLGVMSPHTLPSSYFKLLKGDVSPYRSLSRLFINYAYLELKKEPDFINSKQVREFMNTEEVKAEIKRLNDSPYVLYAAALRLKLTLLQMMYDTFIASSDKERKNAFQAFKQQKGEELENLCLFEALLENHPNAPFWQQWTDATDDITSKQTAEFKQAHQNRIDFYAYCHWLADVELKAVQQTAQSLGMKIGLYADMPIGAASNGAEVWENPKAYTLKAGVGAPADPMRPRGQSWGFTPYHPLELVKQHYAPFIRLVKENMAICKALRIDHAMGLKRLFWIFFAKDNPVVQGAYIHYDMKALTAILCLESNRSQCLLIGEDLGTVPEGFREYMAEHGLLSYKVFFRQKEKDGTFIAPKDYMYMSLAQSSTHDQATSFGFWANEDIEVFKQCNLYVNEEQYRQNLDTRRKDRENMVKAFQKENIVTPKTLEQMKLSAKDGATIPENLETPVNIYGAKTNSALYLVRLCDIYAQKELDNAPGTIDEYANWRLKLSHDIDVIKQTPTFANALSIIKQNRPK